jgi:hypothetical protein
MMLRKFLYIKNRVFKIIIAMVVLTLWFTVDLSTAFLWTVFLLWWAFRLDPRILGGIAIAFLVAIPVAQYFGADAKAEQLAVYVYFLLVMVVALQIIEYRRDGGADDASETTPSLETNIRKVTFAKEGMKWKTHPVIPLMKYAGSKERKIDL